MQGWDRSILHILVWDGNGWGIGKRINVDCFSELSDQFVEHFETLSIQDAVTPAIKKKALVDVDADGIPEPILSDEYDVCQVVYAMAGGAKISAITWNQQRQAWYGAEKAR